MRLYPWFTLPLVAIVFLLASCSGTDVLNAWVPRDGYQVVQDVAYGNEPRQKLDVYVPDNLTKPAPVIVFFYGGSWQSGSKKDYRFVGQAFASRGYIAVIADYRVYPQVYFPEFMNDGAEVVAWSHRHMKTYGGDDQHIFVAGHSAGAHIAALLALDKHYITHAGGERSWIKGVIGLAGPYDFLPFLDDKIKALFSKVPPPQTQPITFVRSGIPPMLLLTGENDEDVLPRNSINLTEKLKHHNNDVTLKIYPDVAHIGIILSLADGFRGKAPVLDDIDTFIKRIAGT